MKRRMRSTVSGMIVTIVIFLIVTGINTYAGQFEQLPSYLQPKPTVTPTPAVLGQDIFNLPGEFAVVKKVVDGDTVELSDGKKVRYIGIDTPESKKPNTPVQCFAIEASKRNEQLVAGKTVRMVKDVSETDRYGRLLRYVYVDEVFVNEQLVAEGYAFARSFPPDIKEQTIFASAEAKARDEKQGLWGKCLLK
jgi:micrococcal nuclease